MLVSFGAQNFFSFKEGFDISFEFGNQCPMDISQGHQLSHLICIKGANSSGKTNILRGLNFFRRFCCDSFLMEPDGPIEFDSFFNNEEPSLFYITFLIDKVLYQYDAILTEHNVISEKLSRKNKREVLLFVRTENTITHTTKEYSELAKIPKLRRNASVIATAKQYGLQSIEPIYDFFKQIISNVSYSGLRKDHIDFKNLNKFLFESPDFLGFVKQIIQKFDPAVKDISIRESDTSDQMTGENEKNYVPVFMFDSEEKKKFLSFNLQSSGTKSLYKQLVSYKMALKYGTILILDEFDINLHPHILPHLLDLFLDKERNTNNAQLLFTTHNTEVLDLLGRYRTYLVNKEGTESYCYRLDEIPGDILRNDRSITPAYNQGKIGGVPKL